MMINVIEAGLPPMVLSEDDSSPAGNHRSKGILAKIAEHEGKLSYWQLVFLQSRANGCLRCRGSSPCQLAVAHEHLVSGSAERLSSRTVTRTGTRE